VKRRLHSGTGILSGADTMRCSGESAHQLFTLETVERAIFFCFHGSFGPKMIFFQRFNGPMST
jgi:hypothetical protein